ncbi:MAG TPA: hypothetical protein VFL34_16660 [Candidatus Sulfotelmatobacter sp.]|nr:hypothetical protein [Candidatus Sulfotelmatobacter sp.]
MKHHRVWIEILLLGTLVALALALLIALGAAAGATSDEPSARQETPSPAGQTYEGLVTCSRCGARHSRALGQTAGDCTRLCVRSGVGFALVDSDTTYLLDGDLGVLGRLAGKRARVVGELNGNTLRVFSAAQN